LEPAFQLAAMGLGLGAFVNLGMSVSYRDFLAPGLVASYAMFAAALECSWGAFSRMELQRTYDAILATPLMVDDVVAGELLWGASRSVIGMTAVLAVLLAFGVPLSPWTLLLPPAMLAQGLMFGAIALVFVTWVKSVNEMEHFFVLFLTPMFLFGGVFYPISSLPAWVQTVSWFFPLSHGVAIARGLLLGQPHVGLLGDLLWMLVVGLGFAWLTTARMRRKLIQ
jgi:lipooligosaccharide transport system permease protein